ncbi:MAG TPA: HEAT repeat domain-containing protein [Aggregatilineaceae bacterium]|nr:HEAT repeat domain-containing protein [Aggregatilineaceae bacterium]
MRFDPLSYVLGFLTAAVISLAAWFFRARLVRIQETAGEQIEGTRQFIGRAADARYARDMTRYFQQYHIAGNLVDLPAVLLEPHLIPPPSPLFPPGGEDAPARDVFDVIPMFHDIPQSYAPFNVESITLDDLGAGDRHVAILAAYGMGKSTTLATLALMALGEVQFEALEDMTQQAIDEQEKGLTKEERAQRARERERIQERAMEKLHDARERQREQLAQTTAVVTENLPRIEIRGLLPIYIHVADLDLTPANYGKDSQLDPAEPLMRAAQRYVSTVTAQVVGSVIYPALDAGRALVLVDGYDEASPKVRDQYFYWLQQFRTIYGQNMIVIAGPAEGYETLVTLGFTPCFLRAWREDDYTMLAKRWAAAWTAQGQGRQKNTLPDDQVIRRISVDNRGRSILDVTLKIWAGLADDTRETGRVGWYDAMVNRKLSDAELGQVLPVLASHYLEAGSPVPHTTVLDTIAKTIRPDTEAKKAPKPEEVLETLVKDGLLVVRTGNSYSFPHPQIASFLASIALVETGVDRSAELATNPIWRDVLGYAAGKIDLRPYIIRKLSTAPDLFYSELFNIVYWLPDAPSDAGWRADLFKRLAAALMAPEQFIMVRERAMAALIASRDKNILFILRQALHSTDPEVRRIACVGIGALGDPDAIKDLEPMLTDQNHDVQLAAGLALGAIGTDHALEVMVHGLLEGSEELRRAVAEALAAIPNEGHAILRDGIESEDILIRRASVYGLGRIKAPWALVSLYRAMLEDEQWYVRSAAEEAFMQAQSADRDGPHKHPEADALVWLIQWAADRGEGVPAGVNARQALVRVLQEGQPIHQQLAAVTLARLGHVPAIKPLYNNLRNKEAGVRGAAYSALADLQMRLGQPLPGLT